MIPKQKVISGYKKVFVKKLMPKIKNSSNKKHCNQYCKLFQKKKLKILIKLKLPKKMRKKNSEE